MSYTAEHIDTEKLEAGLENNRKYQEELHREAIKRATAEFQGYCKCLEEVREMLHCSNYESKEKETAAYKDGADTAFYELCKELDISSQDIRGKNISIDQKAYMIAERIKETICDKTPGKINWVDVGELLPTIPKEKAEKGDREIKVLIWDGKELDKASYLPGMKNFFDLADEPICGVTHWAIFDPPKRENRKH